MLYSKSFTTVVLLLNLAGDQPHKPQFVEENIFEKTLYLHYEKYIKQNRLNKYGTTVLKLPVPKLIAFYNGTKEQPDEALLKLSDSFPCGADADIEVKVRMINVNIGRSLKILDACKPLSEYAWLVNEIRMNTALLSQTRDDEHVGSVVDQAITAMPDDYLIKPFLEAHRAEVKGMLLTEYNEVETMELFKEDGRREGMAEGRIEGKLAALADLAQKGIITVNIAAAQLGISESEFLQKMVSVTSTKG